MTHHELEKSGLSKKYRISPITTDINLSQFIGKTVRYKRELLTDEFLRANGTVTINRTFVIREVQNTYRNEVVLRGYAVETGDTWGRPIHPEHIEIV